MVREVPLSVVATWPKPNHVDPQRRGYAAMVVALVLIAISTPTVLARLYTRHFMRQRLGWDDLWCTLAWLLTIGFSIAIVIYNYVYKCDLHVWDLPLDSFQKALLLALVCKFLFTLAGMCIRQSLLCFYSRLLGDAGIAWFRWVLRAATAINIAAGAIFSALSIFICRPVSAYWHYPSSAYGTCYNEAAGTLTAGIFIAVFDLTVVLLPMPIILRLRMSARSKFGVVCLLTLGTLASISAGVRCYYIWKALIGSYDVSWYAYPLWLSTTIELNIAIVCSCAPALRPFIKQHLPRVAKLPSHLNQFWNGLRSWRARVSSSEYTSDSKSQSRSRENIDPKNVIGGTEPSKGINYKVGDIVDGRNMYFEATQLSRNGSEDDMMDNYGNALPLQRTTYPSDKLAFTSQRTTKKHIITLPPMTNRGLRAGDNITLDATQTSYNSREEQIAEAAWKTAGKPSHNGNESDASVPVQSGRDTVDRERISHAFNQALRGIGSRKSQRQSPRPAAAKH